jgi:hypothetical protein
MRGMYPRPAYRIGFREIQSLKMYMDRIEYRPEHLRGRVMKVLGIELVTSSKFNEFKPIL